MTVFFLQGAILRHCSDVGPHRYAFLHKSLLEFFAASHLFNGALLSGWVMSGRNLSVGNLQDEPQVIAFLADTVKENEAFKQVLFAVIDTSKYEPSAWVAAANAITVLNRARVSFSRCNFKRVRLGGIDEQGKSWGADLSYALLSGTDLREADLRFVNLSRAWMEAANLSGACMDGVIFGEWAYVQGNVCTYSADGKVLAVVSEEDGFLSRSYKITLYEGEEQRIIKTWWMKGQKATVTCLAFRPDGQQLASGSWDHTIRLWNSASGRCEAILAGHTECVTSVSYRGDGKQLASSSDDKTIRLWDVVSGRCEATLAGHAGGVRSVSYRGDGKQLASGSWDYTIRLWDVASGRCEATLAGRMNWVTSVSYRSDGQQLASGSLDHTIRLWEVASGRCEATLAGHTYSVESVSYRGDGQQLASGSHDKTIRLWDVASGRCEATLAGHTSGVTSISYRGDGQQLASSSTDDNTIRLWDVASGRRCEATLAGHTWSPVNSVSYRGDGQQLASGSWDQTIRLWDVASGRCEAILAGGHTDRFSSVSYRSDGQQLASAAGGYDKTIHLLDVASGRCEAILAGHTDRVRSVSYRGDGQQLASGSRDQTIRLWDSASGRCEATLVGHTSGVTSISYRGDGQQLASGSNDKTIRLWDVKNGQCKAILKKHASKVTSLAYHPSGAYLASADQAGTLCLWDTRTDHSLAWWPHRHHGSIASLAWSPRGDGLVTGGYDGAVRLWQFVQKDKAFHLTLCWQSTSHLISFNLNLTQVTGLSPANHALLQQRGAVIGEPSKTRKSEDVTAERNAQIYIPSGRLDQPWLDNPQQGSFAVTPKNWLIALVRKSTAGKGASKASGGEGQHVWLVIQGLTDDNYSFIKEIHFFVDSNKPTKYHHSIGTGLIQIRDKSPFDLERQMQEGELTAKVWGVSRDTVMNELLSAIEQDQTREVGYLFTGKSAPLLFKAEAYSCLSWCVKQLQEIGLNVEPQSGWFNCIFAVPSRYLPATEADTDKKGKRKHKKKGKEKEKEKDAEPDTKCRLM